MPQADEATSPADAPAAPAAPPIALELALPPAELARLLRGPALAAMQAGRARSSALQLTWYDTPDGALAGQGLALELARQRRGARQVLRRVLPPHETAWLPGTLPPLQAEARLRAATPDPTAAGLAVDAQLVAIAACQGRQRILPLAVDGVPASLAVLDGKLHAVAAEAPFARLVVTAPAATALAIAGRLAAEAPLLPAPPLAEAARALARNEPPRPARRGPPALSAAMSVEDGLVHAALHLSAAMLAIAPQVQADAGTEAVHQMRVALRRLRSAFAVWRRAASGDALRGLDQGLRDLARRLGPVRDRDVFLAGMLAATEEAMAGGGSDRSGALAGLRSGIAAQRATAHRSLAAWLDSAEFRALVFALLSVVATRGWRHGGDSAAVLETPLPSFAAGVLHRRHRKLMKEPKNLAEVPVGVLHDMRLRAKRLRYAAEFFAGLFPGGRTKRYLRRLSDLQEALGIVNDGAVAAHLVAALPGHAGRAAGARAWAAGAVEGFAAGRAALARDAAGQAWRKFRKADPFWTD